jgi:hypothetical protein
MNQNPVVAFILALIAAIGAALQTWAAFKNVRTAYAALPS